MTHEDIYIKFMIEYDKANVASSYPSLTEYEVATFLDKAYNAIIAQKVTGNNPRRATFEADVKSISDLQGLIVNESLEVEYNQNFIESLGKFDLPDDFLYLVSIFATINRFHTEQAMNNRNFDSEINIEGWIPVKLVSHEIASQFIPTLNNIPWVKNPVCYIEDGSGFLAIDPKYDRIENGGTDVVSITYIKQPNPFVKNLDNIEGTGEKSFFKSPTNYTGDAYKFELSDAVANEVITLAVTYALENTEQGRFNSHAQLRPLEA